MSTSDNRISNDPSVVTGSKSSATSHSPEPAQLSRASEDVWESPPGNPNYMIHSEKIKTEHETIRKKMSILYDVFLRLRDFFILMIFLAYSLLTLYLLNYKANEAKDFALAVLPIVTLVIGIEKSKENNKEK
jgi:hypothetical protein